MDPLTFRAETRAWDGPAAWFFAHLPTDVADDIADAVDSRPRTGFGSVRVEVTVGGSTWRTSLFPSKQAATYLLPLKRSVREAEGIHDGGTAEFTVRVLD